MGLVEAAARADAPTRQALVQQVEKLYRQLPKWALHSQCSRSTVPFGYIILKARTCSSAFDF